MKKVMLVGRGPSAQFVPYSDDYITVALNNSLVYCETVDYLFMHDLETLSTLDPENIAKVDTLVLPAHPWVNERQFSDFTYADFIRNTQGFTRFEVYEGSIESPGIEPFTWLPRFEDVYSCGDAAVAWLLHKGFREFVLVGIDPGGGHAPPLMDLAAKLRYKQSVDFDCPACGHETRLNLEMKHLSEIDNSPEWYGNQYKSLTFKILAAGGTFVHLSDLQLSQVKESVG